jgi:hypothetical protein
MKNTRSVKLEDTALGPVLLPPEMRKSNALTVACVLTAARSEYLRGVRNGPWGLLFETLVDRIGLELFGRKLHWGPLNLESWDLFCSCTVTPENSGVYLLSFSTTGQLPSPNHYGYAEVIMICGPTGLYPNSFIALTQDRQLVLDRVLEAFRVEELAGESSPPNDFPWASLAPQGVPIEKLSSQVSTCATSAYRATHRPMASLRPA